MSTYYMSACHNCKEWHMWDKTSEDWAYKWHFKVFKKLHQEHDTQFGNDYDDDFYDKITRYNHIRSIKYKGVEL